MSNNNESKETPPAICYSTNNSDGPPLISQPRPPRNLQDLLRYSTEAANALGVVAQASSASSLDEESKQFLEGAVNSMTVDIVEELIKCVNTLKSVGTVAEDEDLTEYEEALDNIFDYVDNLDVANDFQKIGGFCVFQPCLESSHSSFRWRGAELIAQLCQNNPYCQSKFLETGLMPSLLKMVDTDVDELVQVKALYAISCLVRENEDGLEEFTNNDGFSVLLRALQSNVQKLNIKSAFLLSSLCHWKPEIKDDLISMGYVEQLISQLAYHVQMCNNFEHPPSLEHLLNAILDIIKDHTRGQDIARKPELQFKNLLHCIQENSENNEQYDILTGVRSGMENVRVIRRNISKLFNNMEMGVLEVSDASRAKVTELAMQLAKEHDRVFDSVNDNITECEQNKIIEYTEKIKALREFLQISKSVCSAVTKIPEIKLQFSGLAKDWAIFKSMYDAKGFFTQVDGGREILNSH